MKFSDVKTAIKGSKEAIAAVNVLLAALELQGIDDTEKAIDLLYDYERQAKELKKLRLTQPRKMKVKDSCFLCPNCNRKVRPHDLQCSKCGQVLKI